MPACTDLSVEWWTPELDIVARRCIWFMEPEARPLISLDRLEQGFFVIVEAERVIGRLVIARTVVGCTPMLAGSAAQDDIDAVKDLRARLRPQTPDPLREKRTIKCDDLRHVGDRLLRQPSRLVREQYVARRASPDGVARQRHAHDRGDATAIQWIPLDHNDGPSEARTGARGFGHVCPPDVPLRDVYHSTLLSIRRPACFTKESSEASPSSSTTTFIASVTSSGACRVRYSARASAYNWLRDFRVRFA